LPLFEIDTWAKLTVWIKILWYFGNLILEKWILIASSRGSSLTRRLISLGKYSIWGLRKQDAEPWSIKKYWIRPNKNLDSRFFSGENWKSPIINSILFSAL
jgi:hypothetical protein